MENWQNYILRSSNEKTLQLIELYREQECLWNVSSIYYRHKEKRYKAAEYIAQKLAIPDFNAKHVIIKFSNIRSAYCQELKKIAKSLRDSPDEVYQPKVFWFHKMKFIRPYLQSGCLNKLEHSKTQEPAFEKIDIKKEAEDLKPVCDTTNSIEAGSELTDKESLVNIELSEDDECQWEIENRIPRKRAKVSKQRESTDVEQEQSSSEFVQLFKSFREIVSELKESKEDHCESFGRYVASMLRKLPEQKSMRLQPQIIDMIVSAGFETTNDSNE